MREFAQRLKAMSIITGIVATVFTILAAILFAIGGRAVDGLGVTLGQVAVTYFGAAAASALALALLLPLTRWRTGSYLVGAVAVLPLYVGVALVMLPRAEWIPGGVWLGLIAALVVGGPVGLYVRQVK